jgi:hypothetical protein
MYRGSFKATGFRKDHCEEERDRLLKLRKLSPERVGQTKREGSFQSGKKV